MYSRKGYMDETYEILGYLGSGSGGVIYKAYHKRLQKEVVLKKIKRKSRDARINRNEVDILKNLNHMYLPQVVDFFEENGEIYTAMSFIPGRSLKELMEERRQFSQRQLIRWAMQLCSALNYLHTQTPPIIHGDIKPANIMVTPRGDVCLIDFNVSFAVNGNTVLGYTEGYASPEQYIIALDSREGRELPQYRVIDEKSDIYSTGATLFHLITGKKAGRNRTKAEEYLLKNYVSEAFAAVILKAMDPKSEKRYKNAREMFQALQNVYKKDARYRKLVIGQRVAMLGLVAGMGLSIIAIGYGIHTMKLEKVNRYNEIVKQQTEYRKSGEYEKEEAQYQKAINLLPAKEESYFQNACALYEQKEYQDCIDFIDYDIFQNEKVDLSDDRTADLYYLKAESCFELEDYGEAVKAFKKVFQHGGQKSEFYRDYAIALAYNDELDKAKEVLDHAEDYQIADDSLLYARGEIEKSSGNTDKAEEAFRDCISKSENEELIMRSYVMLSELAKDSGNLSKERNVLQEAKEVLPVSRQMVILERLIQVDIDLADAGKTSYRNEAIELLQEVIDQGWDTYETYNNLVILNEKQGNLTEAQNALDTMKEQFGDDYNIEKRAAFLEIDKQEQKANKNRDYTAFAEYYEKAEKMYYEQLKNNDTDAEMDLLENVYQQVRSGGWIEE